MKFNLKEIFDIAISIEKSGYVFYTKAAKTLPEYSDFFTFLANEEIQHDVVFTGIKNESISKEVQNNLWDPEGIISVYFDSLADSAIFNKEDNINELFSGTHSIDEVIDWALKREHDTILFFIGLKSTLETEEDKLIVEKIISEEINHVHILMNKKSELILK